MRHTVFNIEAMNKSLSEYSEELLNLPHKIDSYEDFTKEVMITYDHELCEISDKLINLKLAKSCNFNTSSATSGKRKLLPQRIWRSTAVGSYAHDLINQIRKTDIFNENDIVANLFSAGDMSTLYEGCNRILEACRCSILPVARLDINNNQDKIFEIMTKLQLNCLFGTPNSIVNCINLAKNHNVDLKLKKLVYTGEMFHLSKIKLVRSFYPDIKIFGLYGHSESGFVGFNTPTCEFNHYHLLAEHFFFETTDNQEILITDLTNPVLPLLRYYVGDHGEIINQICPCGQKGDMLFLKGRSDKKFNFIGNLISYHKIQNIIKSSMSHIDEIQIQLRMTVDGKEKLNIVLNLDDNENSLVKNTIQKELEMLDEINEAISKNIGEVCILPKANFIYSSRQKLPLILDFRG